MQIRLTILSLVSLFLLASCSKDGDFTLTGKVNGLKKGKIYLYDFDVKCIGATAGNKPPPARIKGVPAAPDAIREFLTAPSDWDRVAEIDDAESEVRREFGA